MNLHVYPELVIGPCVILEHPTRPHDHAQTTMSSEQVFLSSGSVDFQDPTNLTQLCSTSDPSNIEVVSFFEVGFTGPEQRDTDPDYI